MRLIQLICVKVKFFLQLRLLLLRFIKLLSDFGYLALALCLSQLQITLLAHNFILLVRHLSPRLKELIGQVRDDLLLVLVFALKKLP